jgi:hypothetical protein
LPYLRFARQFEKCCFHGCDYCVFKYAKGADLN